MFDDDTYKLITERFDLAVSGITRIEKASGIQYPIAYVDPLQIRRPLIAYGLKEFRYIHVCGVHAGLPSAHACFFSEVA